MLEPAVEIEVDDRASPREELADALLRVANARDCRTIALEREQGSAIQEIFRGHAGDELVREAEGVTIWAIDVAGEPE